MKLFTMGAIAAGLVLYVTAANAQGLSPNQTGGSPYTRVSDVSGPYAAMPPEAPPRYYGPQLLPPAEVYTILRESGFSPLGIPRQRGFFYSIAVIDRGGDDGRLLIDARNGRIVRFVPAYRMSDGFYEDTPVVYGSRGPVPPVANYNYGGVPRPPASVPRVASRSAPLPKPSPLIAKVAPAPAQQSAAVEVKAPDPEAVRQAAAPNVVEAKPAAPQIAPTQPMPRVQGLD